ncbi:MAG: SDR family NAD(P)-dependent oxidoreductase [Muribaculaceae bacterium]|nr:SDR family NAD(P)-dependent oxidoreductase [Muribaculaceae bacterium]
MTNKRLTIVIVGASSGLGRAVATEYASRGWLVGVCARREQPLAELASRFPENIRYRTLDVTAPDSGQQFIDFVTSLGGMDIVLYAAGCGWNNPELDEANDERTVQTNVVGFTRVVNAAFKWFANNVTPSGNTGHLCAITSIAGTKGIGISATYSATKRYQNTYLESLSQLASVKKANLTITDIRPGFIDTDLLDTSSHKYPMLMSVPYACKRIVRAIDKHRHVAYIDWRWNIVTKLWSFIPRCLWTRLKLSI